MKRVTLCVQAVVGLVGLVSSLLGTQCRAEDPKYILWFGNSFTNATCCGSSRQVPSLVAQIASLAGHPIPVNVNRSVDGQTMQWHLTNPASTGPITTGLPATEDWDNVVLQDYSTMPTLKPSIGGNLAQHLSSTLAMYQLVAARSPNVEAVMYETWARGPGFSYYLGANPVYPGGPTEMQQELRAGYHASMDNINLNKVSGAPGAVYAPAGDAWQAAGFPLSIYHTDIYHANNRGTLLNSLVLYSTIYKDPTVDDINLTAVLTSLQLTTTDLQPILAAVRSVIAVPEPTTTMLSGLGAVLLIVRALAAKRRSA